MKEISIGLQLLFKDETIHSVTVFCSPLSDVKKRVRITRRKTFKDILINIGKPNYAEREFLKLCKKAKTNPRKYKLWFFPKKKK
jgi:hypothetical protein